MKSATSSTFKGFVTAGIIIFFISVLAFIINYNPTVLNYANRANSASAFFEIANANSSQRPFVFASGEPFGIKLISNGVMVVDLQKGDCPAKNCGIKIGDIILCVNGKSVSSNSEISQLIRNCDGQTIKLVILRNGEEKTIKLCPEICDGSYRAGMWVRDSSAGVGTLTFFTENGIFGGLGHAVCDIDTGDIVPIKDGEVSDVQIHDFQKSTDGNPGALLGGFTSKGKVGEIFANEENGVFGEIFTENFHGVNLPLGYKSEVSTGKAYILTTLQGKSPQSYEIEIKEIRLSGTTKNLVIQVTDEELLKTTGGILQGMSGSPIIQNGRLVGAVTHVFVNDVTMGYGVFAEDMYNSAIKISENSLGQKEAA